MANEFTHDVFLSYSSKDYAVVRSLAEQLRADGLRVWFDAWMIRPGDSVPAKIEEGLEHSRMVILCMSANAFGSDWAQLESGTFRFRDPLNKERRFIPLRLDDAPIKGSLAQFLYVDWLPANREWEYAKLLAACRQPDKWPQPYGGPKIQLTMKVDAKVKSGRGGAGAWRKVAPFAVLSLFSFLCGVGLLCLMLWNVELLNSLGFIGNLYYIVLLPIGLAAAGFLFGVLRSYARYKGKTVNGHLELGGSIVGFALVVIGGFYLPKSPPEAFSITVLVHGEGGPHDLVLRNSGVVWITLGPDPRQERIGDKGQADFKNVPASFRGQKAPVSVEADGFEMLKPEALYVLGTGGMEVVVRRKPVILTGSVRDTEGRPVTNATVRVREVQANVDIAGHFKVTLPRSDDTVEIRAEITAPGFELWIGRLVANGGDNVVQMRRTP